MCELCGPPSVYNRRDAISFAAAGAGVMFASRGFRSKAAVASGPPTIVGDPVIWPRDTWAESRPPLGVMPAEEVLFLLVHHTASGNDYSEEQALDVMRQAYDYHTGPDKGWPDVAYNFFIDRFGRIFEGRAGSLAGPVMADATGGSQGFAQLVCLLGDFTGTMPTPAAITSLQQMLASLADRYGVDTEPGATVSFVSRGSNRWPAGETVTAATISGHRDMSETACPGDTFYPYVHDGLAADVTALLAWAQPAPSTTLLPATTPATTAVPSTTSPSTLAPATTTSTTTTGPPTSTSALGKSVADSSAPSDDDGPPTALIATAVALAAAGAAGLNRALRKPSNG